jgi:hypothetical protein
VIAALSLLAPALCRAAPAPFHRPAAACEAVFDARTPERARLIACYLRSGRFLNAIHGDARFARALPNLDAERRHAWLKARLSVTAEGTLIRLRLDRAGGLDPLHAVARALSTVEEVDDHRQRQIMRAMRFLTAARARHETAEEIDARRGWTEIEDEPLKVQTGPRSIRRGR